MQSKTFERSLNIAPLIPPFSKHFHHFSVITRRQCCVLKPLWNPHCHFESIWLKYILIVEAPSIYLRQIREDVYWTILFKIVPVFLFKNRNHFCIFYFWRESHIKYRTIEIMKNKFRKNVYVIFNYVYRYITLDVSLGISLWIFAKISFFVSEITEKFKSLHLYH